MDFKIRAQVTVFIIVGVLIVVGIVAAVYFIGNFTTEAPSDLNPRDIVDKCVKDVVRKSIDKILLGGGEIEPSQAIPYHGNNYNYLCYQADFYQGCYNIHPMLENQIEKEIVKDTRVGVQNCFDSMREDFENRGFNVNGGSTTYSVDLLPGYVAINLKKKIDISKDGVAQKFENFDTRVLSSIYDLVRVAREVVNSESQFCHFEYNGYMLLYPRYSIKKIDYEESKIYSILDRHSKEEFKFAVRSCAFPPGI